MQGRDVGALVQQLIEAVLAVGSGLTEDHRAGRIADGFAEAVDALAVGLHVQLLQVRRETGEGLGIGQHGGGRP